MLLDYKEYVDWWCSGNRDDIFFDALIVKELKLDEKEKNVHFNWWVILPNKWIITSWYTGQIDKLYNETSLMFYNITEWDFENIINLILENKEIQNITVEYLWKKDQSLENIILFIKIIKWLNKEQLEIFKEYIEKSKKENNLSSFLMMAYFFRNNDFDLYIALLKDKNSKKIFENVHILEKLILELEKTVEWEILKKIIYSKIEELLDNAIMTTFRESLENRLWNNNTEHFEKFLQEMEEFSTDIVKSWIFFKELIKSKQNKQLLSIEDFNKLSPDFEVQKLNLWNLIKSSDELDMLDENNYLYPELFWVEDYKMLYENYTQTYWDIDKWWLWVNLRWVIRDLENKEAIFYMMRDKKSRELLAICKTKDLIDNICYIWTHYVSEKYRKNFSVWWYVMNLALQENSHKDIVWAVSRNNLACMRHFNYWWYISGWFVIEKDKKWQSKKWLQMVFDWWYNWSSKYETKNKSKYNDTYLKSLVWKKDLWFFVEKLDSREWKDQDFVKTCEEYFSKWYVLTRFFYKKIWLDFDTEETYVVFEKSKEENQFFNI